MEEKRVRITISGIVQGVGFRFSALQEARSLAIKGWVRNRADGRVEVIAEGDPGGVDAMIDWCRQGPAMARVQDAEVEPLEFSLGVGEFSIKH
ncbi:MAG: acylphosphatase [Candidatus Omnitrophica bacterium]|nr:acylphosphatase [Candidatus Omnitrophota bacterium]MBD3268851.1 acylphosphatase [Candidatus Omnitrophota bacterium]